MGILNDIWNGINSIYQAGARTVNNIFAGAGRMLASGFQWVLNFIKSAINWTWNGFNALYNGIKGGVSSLGSTLSKAYEWVVAQLKILWNMLFKVLNELFKVTEDVIYKYAMWQASVQMKVESSILGGCGKGG